MRRIAILDTGVGASEDDFVKLHVKKSFDFTTPKFSESNIGLDDNGHGTTCAKIILKNAAKSYFCRRKKKFIGEAISTQEKARTKEFTVASTL